MTSNSTPNGFVPVDERRHEAAAAEYPPRVTVLIGGRRPPPARRGVNGFAALPASAPFGGFRDSGYGKEGGREGLAEFVRSRNVCLPIG